MTEQEVRELIASELEACDLDPQLEADWDSMGHIAILVRLDIAFDGRANQIKELQSAYSVAEILAILKDRGLLDGA